MHSKTLYQVPNKSAAKFVICISHGVYVEFLIFALNIWYAQQTLLLNESGDVSVATKQVA